MLPLYSPTEQNLADSLTVLDGLMTGPNAAADGARYRHEAFKYLALTGPQNKAPGIFSDQIWHDTEISEENRYSASHVAQLYVTPLEMEIVRLRDEGAPRQYVRDPNIDEGPWMGEHPPVLYWDVSDARYSDRVDVDQFFRTFSAEFDAVRENDSAAERLLEDLFVVAPFTRSFTEREKLYSSMGMINSGYTICGYEHALIASTAQPDDFDLPGGIKTNEFEVWQIVLARDIAHRLRAGYASFQYQDLENTGYFFDLGEIDPETGRITNIPERLVDHNGNELAEGLSDDVHKTWNEHGGAPRK